MVAASTIRPARFGLVRERVGARAVRLAPIKREGNTTLHRSCRVLLTADHDELALSSGHQHASPTQRRSLRNSHPLLTHHDALDDGRLRVHRHGQASRVLPRQQRERGDDHRARQEERKQLAQDGRLGSPLI